ncbi:hypothetical protein [Agrobacterium tumefaciens]|uniref:hypothetical protein n=1 Tax=Agrobacterium tumefaciens TaxID=358 RepID=UPI0021D1EBD6|nr:hypothetical protein [Agrobacterium tumefaciens]UXS49261.1 hypothetical protein FY149_18715 [Agrobacterium tumefaciens]
MLIHPFHALRYVSINGVEVGIGSVQDILSRHAVGLVIVNDDDIYRVSISGSGTLLRYGSRYFMVCCRHQVKDFDFAQVGFFPFDEAIVLTSGGVKYFEKIDGTDFHDLLIFDYTDPVSANPKIAPLFFNFKDFPPNAPIADTAFIQVAGYPTSHREYDLGEEQPHLGLARMRLVYHVDRPSNDPALLRLKHAGAALTFDPDGLSGGSAFSVQIVDGVPKAFFAGIICRAGKDDAYMLKSNYIQAALRTF